MTIKEMVQKVNNYNEVASVLGDPSKALRITESIKDSTATLFTFTSNDFSKIRKIIKNVYIEEVVDFLLTCDTFDFAGDFSFDVNGESVFNFDIV